MCLLHICKQGIHFGLGNGAHKGHKDETQSDAIPCLELHHVPAEAVSDWGTYL
jgi:hypothetical protein